jgi:hypothetical protein
MSMSYHHVLLSFQDEPQKVRCIFADLSENDLRTRFVSPYRRGKNILCAGEVIETSRIKTVRIIRTENESEKELKKIQEQSKRDRDEFNRNSAVVLVSLGAGYELEDISEAGEDVTSAFILGPPGDGDRWTVVAAVLNHPWISAIGTAVIAAGLIWLLGWN